ncbi:MAG: hypothetical protein KIS94_13340 [Chitinophagales bacterium]|nr:hypothetical protein [Chitinophagales bacterium]
MKKLLFSTFIGLLLICSNNVNAQAWDKSSKVLSIGIGGSYFYYFGDNRYIVGYVLNQPVYKRYNFGSRLTGQFTFQGEFAVHDYVGIGFSTGVGGRAGWIYSTSGILNFPVGALANFHFYQLIQDKTGKNIHADKLDIYGGVSIGTGVAAIFYNNENASVVPIIYGGPHVGIRYYFTPKVAVNGELGYGKTWVNGGLSFKL